MDLKWNKKKSELGISGGKKLVNRVSHQREQQLTLWMSKQRFQIRPHTRYKDLQKPI